MKKLLALLIVIIGATTLSAQAIKFEQLNHNFGEIGYRGEAQSVVFRFTNTGDKPLVVIRSKVDCSCISVKIPRKPIAVGEAGEIVVTYNPNKELGAFNKGVEIYTNSTSGRTILFIEGNVIRKRR